jgi:ABC-2 type transport system permease protein
MNRVRLLLAFLRIGAMGELAYRFNFVVRLFQSLLELGTALAGVAVVFRYTESLGGWRPEEVVALIGVYLLVGGVIGLVIQPSMEEFIESIREGTLDFTLTKPVDAQFLVSIQSIGVWEIVDIVLGSGVLAIALARLGERVGAGQAAAFALMLLAGGAIVYSFWLMLATCSFWFVRVENVLVIFQSMYEAGRWPISLYPGWMRFGMTFLVPVAFATTVPAEALTGRLEPPTLLLALVFAAGLLVISRLFWKVGVRHYSGASA